MLNIDIDEADVAVLSQNLTRSKELFHSINTLLRAISSKTLTASRLIKPVFAEINALRAKTRSIDDGLALLHDVSEYSLRAADSQRTLASPIDAVGVQKYLLCLDLAFALLRDMKRDIRDFDDVVVSFANTVDKAEVGVARYFSALMDAVDIHSGSFARVADAQAVVAYFAKQKNLRGAHAAIEKSFSGALARALAPLEAKCAPHKRLSNMPYEKGSTGLAVLSHELLAGVAALHTATQALDMLGSPVLRNSVAAYMETRFVAVIAAYTAFIDAQGLSGQDLLILDAIDNLRGLDEGLAAHKLGFSAFPPVEAEFDKLTARCLGLFTEWVRYVDTRVAQIERYNEHSIPEVIVEVVSRIRRIAEFNSLYSLMNGRKLGSWLDVKPPLRFVSVYTSVIQGAEAQAEDHTHFLVSLFLLDLLDELMIMLEINLKEQSGESAKKLSQGFMLVKNVVMIETIVNRLEQLYTKLGSIGMERMQRLKNRFLKLFLDDWNYASYIIIRDMTQITTTNALHGGQNSAKEKEQIKELFKNFNDAFDEALKLYEKFNIQEKDLRSYLSSEIKKLILNAYNKLYDKYGSGEFTKNRAKYIKYDKMQFERVLNERL